MIDYTLILNYKYPNTEWILNGDEYDGLEWLSESTKPTKATLDGLWTETQNFYAQKAQDKTDAKKALLDRLGLTPDDLILLLS